MPASKMAAFHDLRQEAALSGANVLCASPPGQRCGRPWSRSESVLTIADGSQ
jgi:hypothetical protein